MHACEENGNYGKILLAVVAVLFVRMRPVLADATWENAFGPCSRSYRLIPVRLQLYSRFGGLFRLDGGAVSWRISL